MSLRRSPSSYTELGNGAPQPGVSKAQSESSSRHSLSRAFSGGRLDSCYFDCVVDPHNCKIDLQQPSITMQQSAGEDNIPVVDAAPAGSVDPGQQYFSDGRRKVDYVLVFHQRRPSSVRPVCSAPPHRISVISNGNFPPPGAPGEVCLELGPEPPDPGDGDMVLIRQEFEGLLMEAGLEIERDSEVRAHGPSFTRLHAPWPVLSREAEFLKVKMPTKKSYELKEDSGVSRTLNSVFRKLNQPFQPRVSLQGDSRTKLVSHYFSRDKMHLFDIKSKDTFFDNAMRSRIVYEILRRTACVRTCQSMGITMLLAKGVYDAAFPLHDGDYNVTDHSEKIINERQILHREWARYGVFYKYQPVELIRKYFGEKIGLYFAWLGVYTQMLIPASLVGIIVFCYGVATVDTNIPSQEMCDKSQNFTMCPLCDGDCDFWHLSTACDTSRASHLFDNPGTVFFAIFMSLWVALFLEQWKRRQISLIHSWDLTGLEDEEEHPRPKYETILIQKRLKERRKKRKKSKNEPVKKEEEGTDTGKDRWRQRLLSAMAAGAPAGPESLNWKDRLPGYFINVASILFMFGLTFAAVFGVIIYRVTISALMAMSPDPETKANVRVTVTATAVVINLVVILILDEIYGAVAVWLTELEIPKTENQFEERLILKAFLLKFMNAYAPIFYVAFFKGRFAGRPGDYVYIINDYRMEECAPGGCLIELCIQLSIIMLGKQLLQNNLFEIGIPKLKKLVRRLKDKGVPVEEREEQEARPPQQWNLDYVLEPFEGLTPEYMEMIIQFGFVSLFVASFPLAPLLALLNNVIEIRLDAKKFVTELRRPDAVRSKDIGVWFNILSGMGKFSVIINAFVISFTSDLIPRMVYQYMYSPNGSMSGFIDHTLSYFNVSNFRPGTLPRASSYPHPVTFCRYKDYREPPWSPDAYHFSKQYWCVLAARLAFVIIFQNLVMFLSLLVAWVIPDVPKDISEQLKREKTLLVDVFLREEKEKFQLLQSLFTKDPLQPNKGPPKGLPDPLRCRTLPPVFSQGRALSAADGDGVPRARGRAASFSQFSRQPSPQGEGPNGTKHTAV